MRENIMKSKLSEMQKYELEILKNFDEICKTYGLYYSLAGGSMLGAVRHNGFIPWDDDIDICLPRPDYEKLLKISKNFPKSDRYQLVGFEKGNFIYPFLKYCDTRVEIDAVDSRAAAARYLNIDILPVDGLPEGDEEIKKFYKTATLKRKKLQLCVSKISEEKRPLYKIVKILTKPYFALVGYKHFAKQLLKFSKRYKYEESNKVGIVNWGLYGYHEAMDKKAFEKTEVLQFETMKISCMSCWKEYLTNLYGNYMKLPPVDQQRTHEIALKIKNID